MWWSRLQEIVAHRGSTIVLTFIYFILQVNFRDTARQFAWNGVMRSLQERYLEESVREVRNGKLAKELQSAKGLEKLSVIIGAR